MVLGIVSRTGVFLHWVCSQSKWAVLLKCYYLNKCKFLSNMLWTSFLSFQRKMTRNAVTDRSFSSSVNVFAGKNNVHSVAFCANWFFMNWHMLSIISGHIFYQQSNKVQTNFNKHICTHTWIPRKWLATQKDAIYIAYNTIKHENVHCRIKKDM